jgi:hypothetical protein
MTKWTGWAGPLIAIVLVLIANEYGPAVGALCLVAVLVFASYLDRKQPLAEEE